MYNCADMKNNFIYIGALIIIIVIAGIVFWVTTKSNSPEGNVTTNVHVFDTSLEKPDIYKDLVFPTDFPLDAKKVTIENTETLRGDIEEDPTDFQSWLDLAIQYKTVGDFEYAATIWEYLAEAVPTQAVQFNNLGNIYHFFLNDFEKSEKNYLLALEKDPGQTIYYIGLHELYKYSYKQDTSLAEEILLGGIEKTNNPIDLINTLARFYKDSGNKSKAIEYFTEARDKALLLGNKDLANKMQAEIDFLK
jgi:tetratricopeptide (TPR) repeat protein